MKKISAVGAFSMKAGPILYIGFLVVYVILVLMSGASTKAPSLVIVPCVMGVLGYMSWKTSFQGLAEEVLDGGDFLLVRKDGQEETVPLATITNVNFMTVNRGSGARITLTLEKPGKFGSEITFIPPIQFSWMSRPENDIANDLIARTAAARTKHAA